MPRDNRDSPVYVPYGIPGESIHAGRMRLKAERQAFEEEQRRLQDMRQRLLMDTEERTPFIDEQAQFMGQESPQGLTESVSMRPSKFIQSMRDTGTPEPMVQYMQNNPYATKDDIEMSLKANMLAQSGRGDDAPMSVKEWKYYSSLPDEQKPKYLEMKRQAYGVSAIAGVPTMAPKISGLPQIPLSSLPAEANAGAVLAGAKKRSEIETESVTKAGIDLPGIESSVQYSIDLLDKLKNHPGKNMAIGVGGILPAIPGTKQADFVALHEQIKNKQFLSAVQQMRGLGQLSDAEGRKLGDAEARMQRAQTVGSFNRAVDEYKAVLQRGLANSRRKAGAMPAKQQEPVSKKTIKFSEMP